MQYDLRKVGPPLQTTNLRGLLLLVSITFFSEPKAHWFEGRDNMTFKATVNQPLLLVFKKDYRHTVRRTSTNSLF